VEAQDAKCGGTHITNARNVAMLLVPHKASYARLPDDPDASKVSISNAIVHTSTDRLAPRRLLDLVVEQRLHALIDAGVLSVFGAACLQTNFSAFGQCLNQVQHHSCLRLK
jgi:hypothetical protein